MFQQRPLRNGTCEFPGHGLCPLLSDTDRATSLGHRQSDVYKSQRGARLAACAAQRSSAWKVKWSPFPWPLTVLAPRGQGTSCSKPRRGTSLEPGGPGPPEPQGRLSDCWVPRAGDEPGTWAEASRLGAGFPAPCTGRQGSGLGPEARQPPPLARDLHKPELGPRGLEERQAARPPGGRGIYMCVCARACRLPYIYI